MTLDEFDTAYDNADLDDQYAEYIMNNSDGTRIICNGNSLLVAMEDGYMFDTFKDSMID